MLRQLRHGVAHPRARLAVLREFMRRAHQLRHTRGKGKPPAFQVLIRTILTVAFLQLRLEVEHVQHRRRTGHVQVNDALGLGRVVWLAWLKRLCGIKRHVGRRGVCAADHRGQRRGAQAHPRLAEKLPARAMQKLFVLQVHFLFKLSFHEHLIEIQNHIADDGPGAEFLGLHFGGQGAKWIGGHQLGCGGILFVVRMQLVEEFY